MTLRSGCSYLYLSAESRIAGIRAVSVISDRVSAGHIERNNLAWYGRQPLSELVWGTVGIYR